MKEGTRRIIHVDMDAFFAAVEQRDFPQYRGKPVIVGGSPESRGVVATCSYEARKFGVHSAMPSYMAHKLCPNAVFLSGRYDVYSEVSRQLMQILSSYSELIEALSLDEAFIDVTDSSANLKDAYYIARRIKARIRNELNLTASAGISYNKFLAKLASDMQKPEGLTLITKEKAAAILNELPIRKVYGIGRVTEQKMHDLGIKNGKDLKQQGLNELIRHFGKAGKFYYDIIRGVDDRPVVATHIRKSVGKERTLPRDSFDIWEMNKTLEGLAIDVANELRMKGLKGKTVTVKIKYADFQLNTRSFSLNYYIEQAEELEAIAKQLLEANYNREKGVRLLGIAVSSLNNEEKEDLQTYLDFYKNSSRKTT